jgi:hypothetical protein
LVTMDETWLYHHDQETNQQSMEWRHNCSPRSKKNSAGAIEGHFEGKTPRSGRSPRGSCLCATVLRLTGHLQPRRNWPTSVLITHPILRIWSRRTTTCSLYFKTMESHNFSFNTEVISAAETWLDGQHSEFFLMACKG